MRLVLPHLSRSLGVMQRPQTAELTVATSLAALDRLPSGVLLLNSSGEVAFANHSARRIFEDNDGLRLRRKLTSSPGLGDLVTENAALTKAIADAISASLSDDPFATPHFSKCITAPCTSGLANYTL